MAFSAWKNLCLIALKFDLQGIVALNVLGKMVLALVSVGQCYIEHAYSHGVWFIQIYI